MSDTCLTCKFSHGQSEGLECRRNPPLGDERFPLVRDNQWCGEYSDSPQNVASVEAPSIVSMEAMKVISPVPLSTRDGPVPDKKSHAKTPRRKGKHGQETSTPES